MLRRLFQLLVCVSLLACFTQTADAQRTFHIGDPAHLGVNGVADPDNAPDVLYYDSLEDLWADTAMIGSIDQGTDNIDFVLYANQELSSDQTVNQFFKTVGSISEDRQITFRTQNDDRFTLGPAPAATDVVSSINIDDGPGSTIRIENIDFIQNAATHGGAISAGRTGAGSGNLIDINNVSFSSNTATDDGGAVYTRGGPGVSRNNVFDFSNTDFTANVAQSGSGGAIFSANTELTGVRASFTNNRAGLDGGAIYIDSYHNDADGGIPIIDLTAATFTGNEALRHGGAIALNSALTDTVVFYMNNTSFIDNIANSAADSMGGAIYAGGQNITINGTGALFQGNTSRRGGAVYLGKSSTLNMLEEFQFIDNQATVAGGQGGAIFAVDGTTLVLTNGEFLGNAARTEGGAIYAAATTQSGSLVLDGSTFQNNQSDTATGGAVYAKNMLVRADGTIFLTNRAAHSGGALHLQNTFLAGDATKTVSLTSAQFDRNESTYNGGAIFADFETGGTVNAEGTNFLGNTAGADGGAIYANRADTVLNVNNATFDCVASSLPLVLPGNSAGNNGGAIYLDGEKAGVATSRATSRLNAENAVFLNSMAGADGGALFLRYADAKLTRAAFTDNVAQELGGAIYFESAEGEGFIADSARFQRNTATNGGAIYAATATTIQAKDTLFSDNDALDGDGGALFFAAENSSLDVSRTGSSASISLNTATGDGGAIRMQGNSTLIAQGTVFSENAAGGSGGVLRMDGNAGLAAPVLSSVQANGALFSKNTAATDGGAIFLSDQSTPLDAGPLHVVNVISSRFADNEATTGSGGAIHAANARIDAASTEFARNTARERGGALFVRDSDLNLVGSNFVNNTAGGVSSLGGKGGAVYFQTTTSVQRSIYLGAQSGISRFSGNTMSGEANSIYFDTGRGAQANIDLIVEVAQSATVNMADPMKVDAVGKNMNLDIVKTGAGTWTLGGFNDFRMTQAGTTVEIEDGRFELASGASLLLTSDDGDDAFYLAENATFVTKGPLSTHGATLQTSDLNFAAGSAMQLDDHLNLTVAANEYSIASELSGSGNFHKNDANRLVFRGATHNFRGNVFIDGGRLTLEKNNAVADSGRFVTENGSFNMALGTQLDLYADINQPTLVAKSASLDGVNLTISGINGDYGEEFILIHTRDGITGNFAQAQADGSLLSAVDYLTFDLGFKNDRKDYGGTIGLRWYSGSASNIPAWGRFTLDNADDYFNVSVELHDNNVNRYVGDPMNPADDWDGKSLDKFGLGTLELSVRNTYTGATTVHAGELLLTDAQASGLGAALVTIHEDARLGLNFDGVYEKSVTGDGKIVIRGGTVELTGQNNHRGGTELASGVLDVSTGTNIGTELTFSGGVLRNKATLVLDQRIRMAEGENVRFDVKATNADVSSASLTVNGLISGRGDLEKTGKGILALGAANTYTGVSYVRDGGLRVDGSVAGDVRVSRYAAVGGRGRVGGSLFVNSGAYFDWNYAPTQEATDKLDVTGSVTLSDGAVFRPRTDATDFTQSIDGWTVLTYGQTLGGKFAQIDNTFNPFYDFTLDYSVAGEIRVDGELLSTPRALGDIVVTSLALSNKKLYRNAFAQMSRETTYRKIPSHQPRSTAVRGQAARFNRSIWYTPMARANKFGTTHVGGDYDFEAYGMQAGSTIWSSFSSTIGVMLGYERGNLRNTLDQIRSHDYYLGLYYGHVFGDGYELRAFMGGGFQDYTMFRNDTVETYKADYDGSSFEMNVELTKLYAGRNGTLIRPYIAADIEHGVISAGQETAVGNAYRHYGKADLSQFFFRFGFDVEKRWQYVDLNGGLGYSIMLAGDRWAEASVFYPVRGAGTNSTSARLGRSAMTLKTGLNWHLNRQRTNSFFVDYLADLYLDRAADAVMHTGAAGFQVRF